MLGGAVNLESSRKMQVSYGLLDIADAYQKVNRDDEEEVLIEELLAFIHRLRQDEEEILIEKLLAFINRLRQ
jgi:hypothetical protein